MIYLDSCVLIYAVEDDGVLGNRIRQALADVGDEEVAISPLVAMECLTGPIRDENQVLYDHYVRTFEQLEMRELSLPQFTRAASLRAQHRIKTPDALHLAAAQTHGCRQLWTRDSALVSAAPAFAINVFADSH